jgi:Domain of unknown function (DUF932)
MYRYSSSRAVAQSFRSQSPLSNDQIARYAPSVMAEEAHESRGERYAFIPTINVIDGLRNNGFQPFEVSQTKVRDQSKREFTKHMVRLRQSGVNVSGAEVPEIILLNSHDGSSSYQLLSGFFRFVCANGLISGNVQEDIRVRHSGNVVDDVIEGATRVLDNLELANNSIDTFKSTKLEFEEQLVFANSALQLRWGDNAPVVAESLLRARRFDDNKPDLWTTFNRVQENLLRGGLNGRSASGRRSTTRAIGGVNENVKLNRALWSLADGMAQIKREDGFIKQYEESFA